MELLTHQLVALLMFGYMIAVAAVFIVMYDALTKEIARLLKSINYLYLLKLNL